MSRMQREKGARGEREAADMLRPLFPDVARRAAGEESQEGQGRDLKNTPGFCVQVARSSAGLSGKLAEAERAAQPGETPILMRRRNGEAWIVVMSVESFRTLAGKAHGPSAS